MDFLYSAKLMLESRHENKTKNILGERTQSKTIRVVLDVILLVYPLLQCDMLYIMLKFE